MYHIRINPMHLVSNRLSGCSGGKKRAIPALQENVPPCNIVFKPMKEWALGQEEKQLPKECPAPWPHGSDGPGRTPSLTYDTMT